MDDLLRLADQVEAGEPCAGLVFDYLGGWENCTLDGVRDALTGSLDAAKVLHNEVLPGWDWGFVNPQTCKLRGPDVFDVNHHWKGQCDNPAAAWVAAILRAKAASVETGQEENDA